MEHGLLHQSKYVTNNIKIFDNFEGNSFFFHKRIKDTVFFTPTDSFLRFLDYSVKFTLLFQKMQENSSQKKITTINFTFLLKANILTVSNIM